MVKLIYNNIKMIRFEIIKHIPTIKKNNTVLDSMNMEIIEILLSLGIEIGLLNSEDGLDKINELCNLGDEKFIGELSLNNKNNSTDILKLLREEMYLALEKLPDYESEFGEDLSKEIVNELNRNNKIDIFSSLVDMLYNMIIKRLIIVAKETNSSEIEFFDENGYIRLAEKMSYELSQLGIEIKIQVPKD